MSDLKQLFEFLGPAVASLRQKHSDLSQVSVSRAMGNETGSGLAHLESGRRKNASFQYIFDFLTALELEPEDLITEMRLLSGVGTGDPSREDLRQASRLVKEAAASGAKQQALVEKAAILLEKV